MTDFRVLGALEVEQAGESVPLRGARERALLALLLLHANELVTRDFLIDELWQTPPSGAQHALEAQISRLRKSLGANGTTGPIVSRPGGYVLQVDPEHVDLYRFQRLLKEGRRSLGAGEPRQAEASLTEALALWRGPPLADIVFEPGISTEAARLDELWLAAVEARAEARLALGRHVEVVDELEPLVAAHPLHERLRGQLMLALYRSGRQADALAIYREGRRRLVAELGLEPGHELQELERAILRQDPELRCPAPAPEAVPAGAPRRRAWLAAAAAGTTIAVIAPVVAVWHGGGASSAVRIGPTSMGVIDPRTNRVTAEIPLGFKSSLVAAGEGHIWVVDSRGATLRKIDPRTREVQTIPLAAGAGDVPFGIAVGGGAVWVAVLRGTHQVVLELGPDLGEPRREIPFGEGGAPLFGLHPLAVGDRALWAIDRSVGGIWRIDFAERKARKLTEGLDALAIAVAGDAVWVAGQATVTKIDAATGFTLGSMPVDTATAETSSIAVGRDEASIWFASSAGDSLARIDERSVGTTRTFPVGAGPSDIAVGEGAVWVANSRDGTISRVDPKTGTSTSIKLGQAPGGVVAAYGAVWTTPGEPRS